MIKMQNNMILHLIILNFQSQKVKLIQIKTNKT
jgi:hypothetical protein